MVTISKSLILVPLFSISIPPSQSCGPYRVYSNQTGAVMFNVVTNTVQNWPTEARDVFEFLGTVGFFIPVVILLV